MIKPNYELFNGFRTDLDLDAIVFLVCGTATHLSRCYYGFAYQVNIGVRLLEWEHHGRLV